MIWLRALLLVAAPFLLALGLTMPIVRFETLYVFSDTPALTDIVVSLWQDDNAALAAVVALVSVVLPVLKLVCVAAELIAPAAGRIGLVHRMLPHLTRWSMMDVLLVALVIFAAKTSGLVSAFSQPGLWCYAAASVISAVLHSLTVRSVSRG